MYEAGFKDNVIMIYSFIPIYIGIKREGNLRSFLYISYTGTNTFCSFVKKDILMTKELLIHFHTFRRHI